MTDSREETTPAFCSRCQGVVPFAPRGRSRLACQRCGTLFRLADPARELSRRSWRYLLYAAAASGMVLALEALGAAVGAWHPAVAAQPLLPSFVLSAIAAGCLVRSLVLRFTAVDYESLNGDEREHLAGRLCHGMIAADLVDGLFAAGWRPAKIHTALESLREVRPVRSSRR